MTSYLIVSKTSGAEIGEYAGTTTEQVIDAMAQDQGYRDFRHMCSITSPADLDAEVEKQLSDLSIKEIK